jgi:D-alanine-D-alanine ligase
MNRKNKDLKVAVLTGGYSFERNVALAGAVNVAFALRSVGYHVTMIDTCSGAISNEAKLFDIQSILPELTQLMEYKKNNKLLDLLCKKLKDFDLIFPVMHGKGGEDGIVQAALSLIDVPYVGSDHASSAIAMDKEWSKRLFATENIPTPAWKKWPVKKDELRKLKFPLIVKPAHEGSTVGITAVTSESELESAINHALKYDADVIIEELIDGREFTVGVLENSALAVGEILFETNVFDYNSKYVAGKAKEVFPAKIPQHLEKELKMLAEKTHQLLKLKHFSRIDFRVSQDDKVYVLEANSIPGLTKLSLLPQSAAAAGYPFPEFCHRVCQLALA